MGPQGDRKHAMPHLITIQNMGGNFFYNITFFWPPRQRFWPFLKKGYVVDLETQESPSAHHILLKIL